MGLSINAQNIKKFSKDILNNPRNYGEKFEKLFNLNEVPQFNKNDDVNKVVLENGYTRYTIKNANEWPAYDKNIIVTQIDVIYTKYPKNKDFWRTNYYDLLANRIKELFKLDSTLNSSDFEWNIILQTDCNSESEAKQMFHGISITYFELEEMMEEGEDVDETLEQDSSYFKRNTLKVQNFIRSQGGIGDSLVYKIFDRHPEWENAVVVMDWTGSMYQYGAQAVLWHTLNFKSSGIKDFVFFNDGNDTPDDRKVIGETGGVYFAQAKNVNRLVNTFYLVSRRGKGGDHPENDIEALIRGINRFEDFDELILIADNNSCMRDFQLIANLDVKVNVIVCGARYGINPQYINLAYLTGGSIHTMEEDIKHLNRLVKNKEIKVENLEYKLSSDDLFMVKDRMKSLRFRSCEEFTTLNPIAISTGLSFIDDNGGIQDSTVYKVLSRHLVWQNSIIVMDWTKGMYTNSAQAVLWHKMNRKTSGIEYFIFFNDGNKLATRNKKVGRTGGIYTVKSNNIRQVIRRFDYVKRRGVGGTNTSANDLEAIITPARSHPKINNIILSADNSTCIRDIKLLKYLNVPVKVILSNIHGPINPQYINLVYHSGGSLHTLQDDFYNYVFKSLKKSKQNLIINSIEYMLDEDDNYVFVDKELRKSDKCNKYEKENFFSKFFNKE
ncbi:MAG: hypothetical protein DRI84_09535 [Bacteroidetes bacterium]|nr:MAG: hypothetical protein DRI84_09535 [Bacteroidota bacterium]